MKSRKFYKGSVAALENAEFIPRLENGQLEKRTPTAVDNSDSKLTLQDFCKQFYCFVFLCDYSYVIFIFLVTPHAKRAFFISFTSLALSFLSGTLTILAYVTDIFTRTGSSLTEKNSSLLVSITQIIANLVMLNIVERFNRRVFLLFVFISANLYCNKKPFFCRHFTFGLQF